MTIKSNSMLFQWILAAAIVLFSVTISCGQQIQLSGTIVNDTTGKAISSCEIETGFVNKNTGEISWSNGQHTINPREADGGFEKTFHFQPGYRYRIVADGYFSAPLFDSRPIKETHQLKIRMQPGRTLSGKVLNHLGQPVKAHLLELCGRKDFSDPGQVDRLFGDSAAETDEEGRFELQVAEGKSLVISCDELVVWVHAIDKTERQPITIQLPKPGQMKLTLDIPGADEESEIFYQLLTHQMEGFENVQLSRQVPIKNGETIVLDSLPPGHYQFCRNKMMRHGNLGQGAMIDRTFLELTMGEQRSLNFVRKTGSRIFGRVQLEKAGDYSGIIIELLPKAKVNVSRPRFGYPSADARLAGEYDEKHLLIGTLAHFVTERLLPGRYILVAKAYQKLSPEQMRFSGLVQPAMTVEEIVTIPKDGKPVKVNLHFDSPPNKKGTR